MNRKRVAVILLSLILAFVGLVSLSFAQTEVADYMNEVLDILQEEARDSGNVAWEDVREDVLGQVEDAETTADTYPVIRKLLAEHLNDRTGYIHAPAPSDAASGPLNAQMGFRVLLPDWVVVYVWPGSPADEAGMRVGDHLVSVNGNPTAKVDVSAVPTVPESAGAVYINCEVGFAEYCDTLYQLYTPGSELEMTRVGEAETQTYSLSEDDYERQLPSTGLRFDDIAYLELPPSGNDETTEANRTFISENRESCGWIVDLRRHAGGLGYEGELEVLWDAENEAGLLSPMPPTAYLISPLTYSAGENIVGRIMSSPNARGFGEKTGGFHPELAKAILSDGAALVFTKISDDLSPDVEIANDWTRFQTADDPVIQAAVEWLEGQPTCAGD